MKISKILSILFLSLLVIPACDESESLVTGVEGGLVEVLSPSINYVVGNSGPYSCSITVYQGTVKTTKVEVFKSFTTTKPTPTTENPKATTTYNSEEVLFKTIDISASETANNTFTFSLSDLISGLSVNGNALSGTDTDYLIGDSWQFRFVATTNTGNVVQQNKVTKITVATRFAGKYKFIEGAYYRIHVLYSTGDYWDPEYLIESIDAKTYKMNGVCAWMDQQLYFQIEEDGTITYPASWKGVDQIINNMPLITCALNLGDLGEVHCDQSNYVIKDDVQGKDRLVMSFGYLTNSGDTGPRAFYQVMEKIVD